MDNDHISSALVTAGGEYLAALRRLQLEPEGLLWSRMNETRDLGDGEGNVLPGDYPAGEWHLILITAAIDEAGPLAMQEMLFKAYSLSATPKEISPFTVEVMSARSPFYHDLLQALNSDVPLIFGGRLDRPHRIVADRLDHPALVHGLWFDRKWVYQLTGLAPARHKGRRRQWLDFKQSINALAA